ncbi:TPA: hypothetical protein DDW35_02180 [Candidatus Sumerlaeota bacterium]|nr:hypothetical protein [Candidatus Sumerlaeota bacterium]
MATFFLIQSAEKQEQSMDARDNTSPPPLIVVVNDDPMQLRFLASVLERGGFRVQPFRSAEDALHVMSATSLPDAIVTDLHMPGIDGWRFCRLLRSSEYPEFNKVPVLVISATYSGEDAREITTKLGADVFLPAPTKAKTLLENIHALLKGNSLHPPTKVLVVEDSRTVAEILRKTFEKRGYEIRIVETGAAARPLFHEMNPEIIILDYHLPDTMGDALLVEWRQCAPTSVFVMMTNDPDSHLALDFMRKGASAYIAKPFDPEYIVSLCENALRERALLHVEDLLEERTRQYRKSEMDMRTILENLPYQFWLKDKDSRFIVVNDAYAKKCGQPNAEALVGKTDANVWPADLAERFRATDEEVMQTRSRKVVEEMRSQNGHPTYVETFTMALVDDQGNVTGTTGYSQDITERVLAREAIQVDEARLEALLHLNQMTDKPVQAIMEFALEEGVRLTGSKMGYFGFVNEAEKILTMYFWSGVAGHKGPVQLTFDECGQLGKSVSQRDPLLVNNCAPGDIYHVCLPPDHLQLTRYMNVPIFEGETVVLTAGAGNKETDYNESDVRQLTLLMQGMWALLEHRKSQETLLRTEQERRIIENRMQHVQKLESLGVLAGGIAHDFNNILSAILGYSDLALRELPPDAPVRVHLSEVEKASRRAADLCNQMLAYSGKGHFCIESLQMNDLIQEMGHLLGLFVNKQTQINYLLSEDLPLVEVDRNQMRQMITNLVANAAEAIGEKDGILSISTGYRYCNAPFLHECLFGEELPAGGYVFLEVSDNGCGMDAETQKRIFEPFFTTKFPGRGLGLPALMGIVRGHKGAVKITSAPNRGSVFCIYFPMASELAEPPRVKKAAPTHKKLNWKPSGLILVADDEECVRGIVNVMLRKMGFDVILTRDGQEAVEAFVQHANTIELVLLDLTMPILGGAEVFEKIRNIRPDTRVVLSSGFSERDISEQFREKGLTGFIQKPFTYDALQETLHAALTSA